MLVHPRFDWCNRSGLRLPTVQRTAAVHVWKPIRGIFITPRPACEVIVDCHVCNGCCQHLISYWCDRNRHRLASENKIRLENKQRRIRCYRRKASTAFTNASLATVSIPNGSLWKWYDILQSQSRKSGWSKRVLANGYPNGQRFVVLVAVCGYLFDHLFWTF